MAPGSETPARPAVALLASVAIADAALLLGFGASSSVTTWWSSVGLGVALVAMTPVTRWAAAALALLGLGTAVRLAGGLDLATATAVAGVHATEAVVGAAVLTHLGRRAPQLATQGDLLTLVGAALACGAVSLLEPALRAGSLVVGAPTLLGSLAQHTMSVLLLASLAMALRRARWRGSVAELAVQVSALSTALALVLGPGEGLPIAVVPIPMLVWAALRFDVSVVAVEVVLVALAITVATAGGLGPVAAAELGGDQTGVVVLAYVVVVLLVALPTALRECDRLRVLAHVSADQNLLRRTFAESPLGMLLLHQQGDDLVVDDLNDAACALVGADHDAVVGRRLLDVLAPLDPTDHGLAALQRGATDAWQGHVVALGLPGRRLDAAVAAAERRDGSRTYSAQLLDITEKHDADRRLAAAHRLNDATLDTTACLILVADASGTIVRANAASGEITGFGDSALIGQRLWNTPLAVLSRAETEAMFVWPNRSGYPMVAERLGRTASGEPVRIVWNYNVVHDELGMPSYAVLTGIDVTSERSSSGFMAHLLSAEIATALIGVAGTGRITLFNAGAAQMLGHAAADMVGRPFVDLFDPQQIRARTGASGVHDAFVGLVGMIGDRDESPVRDWIWRTRHGHELIVSMTLSVTEDLGQERVTFLCVGRDVTEQREAQETLVKALEKERTAVQRLRALDRAKDEFVSTVSHELRTPVTSIIGYTELLRDGTTVPPSEEQLAMLGVIARNGQRLVTICNDLLHLSGFDSDVGPNVRTRLDLRMCIRAGMESVAAADDDRGVDVRVHLDDGPVEVTGDRDQLDRMVVNLLSNAVKFSAPGGAVEVSLSRTADHAVLEVRDNGIGIPLEDHQAVFQRFYRSEAAQVRAIAGTGLGLPIVAAIVAAHDGEITLDSEPGRGSTFRVRVPLSPATLPASTVIASPPG